MTITPEILTYALLAYSVVFVIVGLCFFAHCTKTICRINEMTESILKLIECFEHRYEEELKHEGTD